MRPRTVAVLCGLLLYMVLGLEVKVGMLLTINRCCNFLSFEDKASAFTIAVDQLRADGVLDDSVSFRIFLRDTFTESQAAGNTINFIFEDDVDVIFGSPQSILAIAAGHITAHKNLPQVTWMSNSPSLAKKNTFRTLVRTSGVLSLSGQAIVLMSQLFKWKTFGYVSARREFCAYVLEGIKDELAKANMTVTQTTVYDEYPVSDATIDKVLTEIKSRSRLVFFCENDTIRHFLIRACLLGMCNGEFVFIFPWLEPPPVEEWKREDGFDDIAKEAYKHMIWITPGIWQGETGRLQVEHFHREVIRRMSEPPWNSTIAQERGLPPGPKTNDFYDAGYLFGLWINHSITHNVSIRDGEAWLEFAKNRTYPGMGSTSYIAPGGDKLPFFWIYQFQGDGMLATMVAESVDKNKRLMRINDGFIWSTKDGNPPPDSPECGLFNELCPPLPYIAPDNTVLLVSCVGVLVVLSGSLLTGFFIRRRKLEKELLKSIWRININELNFLRSKAGVGTRMKLTAIPAQAFSNASMSSASSKKSEDSVYVIPVQEANMAIYRDQKVVIKVLAKRIMLTEDDLQDLKTMREFMHDNLNSFIGASFDTKTPCCLFLYCPKGSLQDILENDEISLDLNFKTSLIKDLVQGMKYIHDSNLESHGRLKSSNCVVDNRWVLKVTDYGIGRFLPPGNTLEEQQKFKSLLWTAPELLVNPRQNPRGTKEGDVYSFSIILHEIVYRMGPFAGHGSQTYEEILTLVKRRESPLCRPSLFTEQHGMTSYIIQMMQHCWDDDEKKRPSFSNIADNMKKNVQQGQSGNIVDVMMQRLEKYATNLEDLVSQRKKQILAEKKKSDTLLYKMLPKSCAKKLRAGETVLPEAFEGATVYFSDIVGFLDITAISTPMQVVDLLNDMSICFDNIIRQYDAYKVETVSDAFLVVSGIPNRNGDQHAGIIADISLEIMDTVKTFKIKHLPQEEFRVRIGNHTGSCCAGIVGLSMPRYCLFGDTVNTASRMESNGAAKKIHISEATHFALENLGEYVTEYRGEMPIKGKGMMNTYWLVTKTGPYRKRRDQQQARQ